MTYFFPPLPLAYTIIFLEDKISCVKMLAGRKSLFAAGKLLCYSNLRGFREKEWLAPSPSRIS